MAWWKRLFARIWHNLAWQTGTWIWRKTARRWNSPRRRWAASRIAKTLAFRRGDGAALIVAAGDARVDNAKFRAYFGERARMLQGDEVLARTGHAPGGVCPFAVRPGAQVYLDVSLKRFDTVYPAGGNAHSAVRLSLEELERASQFCDWIDVCGGYNP